MCHVRCAMWIACAAVVMSAGAGAAADAPWADAGWAYRMNLSCDAGEGDVAWTTVQLNGRCTEDGHDLRLIDADGKPRPFVLLCHQRGDQTTISFQADDGKPTTTWLYFGNPQASSLPSGAWEPRRGVLLRTYRRNNENHPDELTALYKEIERAPLDGAGFREAISDGYNPFGPSERYISSYSAYLKIDKPGRYGFATVSDDGSWALLNDKPIASWPGSHGYSGGEHGEHNGFIDNLGRGIVHIRYYQEEGNGDQMAYLAWQPPGENHFVPIPKNQWLSVREAKADAIESRNHTLTAQAQMRIVNSYWIYDSQDRQATLVKFTAQSRTVPGSRITETRWEFGDGLSATGDSVEHVYFRLGRPAIKLTVKDDKGRSDSVTLSPDIFQVDVVAQAFSYGDANQYAKAAANYDVSKMAQQDLRLYAEFWKNIERDKPFIAAAQAFIDRFGDKAADDAGELAATAAESAIKANSYDPAQARRLMQWAVDHCDKPVEKAERMVKLARLLAWDVGDVDEAKKIAERVKNAVDKQDGKPMRRLERQATIVLGDVALLKAKYDEAQKFYAAAQEMGPDKQDQPQTMAKIGTYPYIVEDLLGRDQYEYAFKTLDEWEYELPTQKLEGLTFFWRGKVLFVQKPGEQAMKWLTMAERVNPQGLFVSESIWLRANNLMAMGRWRDAMDQFMRIRMQYAHSEYFTKAEEKMKICAEKLK